MGPSLLPFIAVGAVLTLATLALVLRPLWSQRGPAIAMIVVLSLATFALYRLVGTPAALDPVAQKPPETLQDAISQLETRLQGDPRQIEGWRLLGQAYASAKQPERSRDAYARAVELAPDDPDVLVEAAESRALATPQRSFDAKAVAWLQHALQEQPQHQRARWFLGIAQRQAGDAAQAAKTWEPLLAMVDASTAAPLRAQIDDARRDAGLPPLATPTAPSAAPGLRVTVRLDPKLLARLQPGGNASVFVIARAPDGPPMPVAAEKHAVAELPLTVMLDDSDSPMPTQRLSQLHEVEVLARLSMSGNAIPQPGDLQSQTVRVQLPANKPVELTIGAPK